MEKGLGKRDQMSNQTLMKVTTLWTISMVMESFDGQVEIFTKETT